MKKDDKKFAKEEIGNLERYEDVTKYGEFVRIRNLREDKDLYQKDIAEVLGISQQYYSEYEKGNRTIPIQHLITLSKFYGTSIDYLVGLADVNLYSKYHKKTS